MSFDWSEYLNVAQELAGKSDKPASQEAKNRSAISRPYYAAFTKARNHLIYKEKRVIPANQNPHEFVRVRFERGGNPTRLKIANNLYILRKQRNMADYDNSFPNLTKITKRALRLAKQVITDLERL